MAPLLHGTIQNLVATALQSKISWGMCSIFRRRMLDLLRSWKTAPLLRRAGQIVVVTALQSNTSWRVCSSFTPLGAHLLRSWKMAPLLHGAIQNLVVTAVRYNMRWSDKPVGLWERPIGSLMSKGWNSRILYFLKLKYLSRPGFLFGMRHLDPFGGMWAPCKRGDCEQEHQTCRSVGHPSPKTSSIYERLYRYIAFAELLMSWGKGMVQNQLAAPSNGFASYDSCAALLHFKKTWISPVPRESRIQVMISPPNWMRTLEVHGPPLPGPPKSPGNDHGFLWVFLTNPPVGQFGRHRWAIWTGWNLRLRGSIMGWCGRWSWAWPSGVWITPLIDAWRIFWVGHIF